MGENESMSADYYDQNAAAFYQGSVEADMSSTRDFFLQHVPADGCILDAGCGSGRDSVAFLQAGYAVASMDASDEMVRMSTALTKPWGGAPTQLMRFQELEEVAAYDGIWACASLLHVSPEELPSVLMRISRAMKPNGAFYCSFKLGESVVERDGRRFTMMTEESLRLRMEALPEFKLVKLWTGADSRPGREEELWVNGVWILELEQPLP